MIRGPLLPWETPETGKPAALAARFRAALPELRTERLRLRASSMEDYPAFAEIGQTEHGKFLGALEMTRSDCFLDFAQCVANWLLNGYGMFTAETDNEVVGFTTLVRGCDDEGGDLEPELGYFFLPQHCGNGYATEAAQAVRDWGIKDCGVASMVSYIDRDNFASVNVAKKLGAWLDTPHPDYPDDHVYRHWPQRSAHG